MPGESCCADDEPYAPCKQPRLATLTTGILAMPVGRRIIFAKETERLNVSGLATFHSRSRRSACASPSFRQHRPTAPQRRDEAERCTVTPPRGAQSQLLLRRRYPGGVTLALARASFPVPGRNNSVHMRRHNPAAISAGQTVHRPCHRRPPLNELPLKEAGRRRAPFLGWDSIWDLRDQMPGADRPGITGRSGGIVSVLPYAIVTGRPQRGIGWEQ